MGTGDYSRAVRLSLLDSFELRCDGERIALPLSAQRLLAFLAVRARPVLRVHLAEMLWADGPQERAAANLRSALWRLRRPGVHLVEATGDRLGLAPEVQVDLHTGESLARDLLEGDTLPAPWAVDRVPLAAELLPDWSDDWVLMEREQYRQLGLHALEALAEREIAAGECRRAVDSAMTAVASEPLRESAQRVLIRAHLAEGNLGEAMRQYRLYCRLLHDQLGLEPSPQMRTLVGALTHGGAAGSSAGLT